MGLCYGVTITQSADSRMLAVPLLWRERQVGSCMQICAICACSAKQAVQCAMCSTGMTIHAIPLCMHSLTIATHAECDAVMEHHFIPLDFLRRMLCLLRNAACHSSQLVHTLCIKRQLPQDSIMDCHVALRFAFSEMRIETAAFALQLTSLPHS